MTERDDDRRLRALASTGLLEGASAQARDEAFDRLAQLAMHVTRAPAATVSLVDDRREVWCSAIGLPEPWAAQREVPLASSLARQVVQGRTLVVVEDTHADPGFASHPAVREMGVAAYAAAPLIVGDEAVGALAVIDRAPRVFTADEIRLLGHVAASVVAEIERRRSVAAQRRDLALYAELRRNAQMYRAVVQRLPRGAVFMIDRDLRCVSAEGPVAPEILSRTDLDTFVGRQVEEIVAPPNRDVMVDLCRRAFLGESARHEVQRDGRAFEASVVPIFEGDEVTHILVFSFDVTDQRREAAALRDARDSIAREQALLETTLANIEDGVALLDADRRMLLYNERYAELLGVSREELRGRGRETFHAIVEPLLEDPAAFRADDDRLPGPPTRGEYVFARPRRRVMRRTWTPVRLGSGEGYLVTWHDITAQRALLREREEQALIDALTGVPNRRAAEAALRTEQERCKRQGTRLCVAMFDIDLFKRVNDEHGHAVGDEVLKAVAAALRGEARMTDTVARWGGEEFVAVLSGPIEGARAFCERARTAVERLTVPPVEHLTISAGLAEVAPGEAVSDALGRADERLYDAKNAGRNRVVG